MLLLVYIQSSRALQWVRRSGVILQVRLMIFVGFLHPDQRVNPEVLVKYEQESRSLKNDGAHRLTIFHRVARSDTTA